MEQISITTTDDSGKREWNALLDNACAHETHFITRYMWLNECTESAARAVYIHVFPQWPRMTTS